MTFLQSLNFYLINIAPVHHQQNLIMCLRLYCRCGQFYKDSTRKSNFFEGCSLFKFNNLKLALGMVLKFSPTLQNFWGPIPTFAEVTAEKLVGRCGAFCTYLRSPPPSFPPNLNSFDKLDSFGNASMDNFDIICCKMHNYYNSFSKSEIRCYATSCVFFVL